MAAKLFIKINKSLVFFLVLFSILCLFFVTRNMILDKAVVLYLKKKYDIGFTSKSISWSYDKLTIENAQIISDELEFNISSIELPLDYYLKVNFSPSFSGASIDFKKFDAKLQGIELVKKKNIYKLNVETVKIKKNTYQDIYLEFQIKKDKLHLDTDQLSLLGPNSKLSMDLYRDTEIDHICADFDLESISPYEIVNIAGQGEKVYWDGEFSGELNFCIDNNRKLLKPHLLLNSVSKGVVDVKDRKALEFMRYRMDERAFNALIDNLNNYVYNNGIITLHNFEKNKMLAIDLKSEAYGTRRFEIVLHD